jgi:hypothetical protein
VHRAVAVPCADSPCAGRAGIASRWLWRSRKLSSSDEVAVSDELSDVCAGGGAFLRLFAEP